MQGDFMCDHQMRLYIFYTPLGCRIRLGRSVVFLGFLPPVLLQSGPKSRVLVFFGVFTSLFCPSGKQGETRNTTDPLAGCCEDLTGAQTWNVIQSGSFSKIYTIWWLHTGGDFRRPGPLEFPLVFWRGGRVVSILCHSHTVFLCCQWILIITNSSLF